MGMLARNTLPLKMNTKSRRCTLNAQKIERGIKEAPKDCGILSNRSRRNPQF